MKRVKYFDQLRIIAIIDVIILHVLGLFRYKYFQVSIPKFALLNFIDQFTRVGVPIFFMLTGALMLGKKMEIKNYKDYFKTKVLKLIFAYLFFGTIFYIYEVIKGVHTLSIFEFATTLTSKNVEYHLWFMPVIISIYILLPFLKKLVESLNKKELETMILVFLIFGNAMKFIYMASSIMNNGLLGNFILPDLCIYLNYVWIGYYLSKEDIKITKKMIILGIISFLLITPLTYLLSKNVGYINDFFAESESLLLIIPSTLVFLFLKERPLKLPKQVDKFITKQAPNIFYIYLIHLLPLKIISDQLRTRVYQGGLLKDFFYILIYVLGTLISSFVLANIWVKLKEVFLKYKEKIMNVLITIFFLCLGIILTIILIDFVGNFYHFSKINYLDFIIAIIGFVVFFKILLKYQDVIFKNKIVNILLIILYIVFQVGVIYALEVKPSWDFGQIYDIAVRYALGKGVPTIESYLYLCDNNIAVATALSLLFKGCYLIGIKNHFLEIGLLLNLICIDISHLFTYLTIRKINDKYSKVHLVFICLFLPLIAYLPIFYTDTLTLPLVAIPLYCLYNYFFIKQKNHYIIISGLLLGIGGTMKPTILIILVATILYCILRTNKKLNYYILIPILLISTSIPMLGYKWCVNHYFDKERLYQTSLPMSHFIQMGLTDVGSFNGEDYDRTVAIEGKDEKTKSCNKVIKQRIKDHIKSGDIFAFYNKKISFTWGYSTLFAPEKLNRDPIHKGYVQYVYSDSGEDRLYWALSNTEWFILLGSLLLGVLFHKYLLREEQDFFLILTMSIFGLFLFLLIWETRSRYLVHMSPVFLVTGYLGFLSIINKWKQAKGRRMKR